MIKLPRELEPRLKAIIREPDHIAAVNRLIAEYELHPEIARNLMRLRDEVLSQRYIDLSGWD
jgi:hypothetical protein